MRVEAANIVVTVEVGLTGEDWEPTAEMKYYAQIGKQYAFGPTKREAISALKKRLKKDD